jgi:ribosomal protein L18E
MAEHIAMGRSRPMYLIVADETDEFKTALYYAEQSARRNNVDLAVLQVVSDTDGFFLPWKGIAERIEHAQKQHAEASLEYVKNYFKSKGIECFVYLREGNPVDVVSEVIKENALISKLILAANTTSKNPGPLVSYFSGAGLRELEIPLTIVPSHLTNQDWQI